MPLRSSSAANLYFAGDARDIEGNLTEICLKSAIEVTGAVAQHATSARRPAIAVG